MNNKETVMTVIVLFSMISMLSMNSFITPNQSYAQIVPPKSRSSINPAITQGQQVAPQFSVPSSSSLFSAISANWARWVLQIPAPINPILDPTGANCAQNQNSNGRFWFLVGDFGGTVVRKCDIPQGRVIFLPVINALVTEVGSISQDQAVAKQLADMITSAQASVDSVPLSSSNIVRSQSVPFGFVAPHNEIVGDPPGPGTGVTDGFWVLLQPLAIGQHTIHFAGQTSGGFSIDVTYQITVK